MTASPYRALDVIETFSRIDGRRWWVRDEEHAHLWNCVEYIGNPGRLTCYCPDGQAHAESPYTEAPCAHLSAVVDERMRSLAEALIEMADVADVADVALAKADPEMVAS